ncbi:MAG: 50S ribosomal protein L18e [archaeon]|nr:50S ribosomal protein L18e [archaeon]
MAKPSRQMSRTRFKVRAERKLSPGMQEIMMLLRKNHAWAKHLKMLSMPAKMHVSVNLSEIDKMASVGDTVLVPGKVLSLGEIAKKVRICSFGISKSAREKLKKTKSQWVTIAEEIKANPKAEGIKIAA